MALHDVTIVGAGVAGLTCAAHLHRAGYDVLVLESSEAVGGRIRTDRVDGFLLDRGFQVLPTAYPETQSELDYEQLRLGRFTDGALIRVEGAFHRVMDPFRHPRYLISTLRAPIGGLHDKLRLARLRWAVRRGRIEDLLQRPETTTERALIDRWGFSQDIIDRFFRPFIGGMTFDPSLRVSSRMFEFMMRMFATGPAALPGDGMAAIPEQIAASLPDGAVRLGQRVSGIEAGRVIVDSDTAYETRSVVVATDASEAGRLTGRVRGVKYRSASCLYFAASAPPFDEPILVLNGEPHGPILNLSVQTNVVPAYSPDGRALIAVIPRDGNDEVAPHDEIRAQLEQWFGPATRSWQHLKTYHIPRALPEQAPPYLSPPERSVRLSERLYVCGDHLGPASINGAMASGRHAARAVAADLRRSA